jgi:hypothetical protein
MGAVYRSNMYELKNISALSCFQGQDSVRNFVSIHLAERVNKNLIKKRNLKFLLDQKKAFTIPMIMKTSHLSNFTNSISRFC